MFIYFSEMERRGRKRPLAADVDTVEKDPLKKILNCPDILEQIFKFTDIGTLIGSCALVCKQWNEVINGAPWYLLPKRHYKEIIISAQNELEIKLEPDVHCDNSPKTEAEAANPKKPRKLWKIIRREYPEQEDIPKLMRHLSCESLQFQSLGGAFLPWLLKELSKLLKNVERITFNFCNFQVRCQGAPPLPSGALVNTVYIYFRTRVKEDCEDSCGAGETNSTRSPSPVVGISNTASVRGSSWSTWEIWREIARFFD